MRKIGFIVYLVLLLSVSVTVVVAEASQDETPRDNNLLFQAAQESIADVERAIVAKKSAQEESDYKQQVKYLQELKLQERRNLEAKERFGKWGPVLVQAAEMYGQDPGYMYSVMMCESKGDPYADNGINKGLFQFHPSTFAGTPYGGASIYDGESQIYAAAWMWSQGRIGEWTCAYA